MKIKQSVAIIGGGPAALILAALLDEHQYVVHIYERNAAVGRKFLVAGDGGFNLTHSEDIESFVTRYTPQSFLDKSLRDFSNTDLCNWLLSIGIETYVGTSKRIFPIKGIKPIEVLTAILDVFKRKNIQIHTRYHWTGLTSDNKLKFIHQDREEVKEFNKVVFALGGASWKVTGSDGKWSAHFAQKGIQVNSFQSSNCAYKISWPESFIQQAEGKWLKNIAVSCDEINKKGELVLTKFGLEGGVIYALSPQIRKQFIQYGKAEIFIDLKPTISLEDITVILSKRGNKSISKVLSDIINLSEVQLQLLKSTVAKNDFLNEEKLAQYIKQLPLTIIDSAPLDEAISTVGGINLNEVDSSFQLKKLPNHYVIGEMLDWDAPTGGYLLQGCFSMGAAVAKSFNKMNT